MKEGDAGRDHQREEKSVMPGQGGRRLLGEFPRKGKKETWGKRGDEQTKLLNTKPSCGSAAEVDKRKGGGAGGKGEKCKGGEGSDIATGKSKRGWVGAKKKRQKRGGKKQAARKKGGIETKRIPKSKSDRLKKKSKNAYVRMAKAWDSNERKSERQEKAVEA